MPHAPKTLRPRGREGAADREYEARRTALAWRAWYKTARWVALRRSQLNAEPLCALCQREDRVTSATVCDHVEPHRGDPVKFWQGPFQSLCTSCHNRQKQRAEANSPPPVRGGGWGGDTPEREWTSHDLSRPDIRPSPPPRTRRGQL